MADLDLADIQGIILRGYTMPLVRYLVLRIDDAGLTRRALGRLAGPASSTDPQVTTAEPWEVKPPFCLNLGFTYDGLRAVGLPESSLSSFPTEFVEGAVARAAWIGSTGESAPEFWRPGLAGPPAQAHLLLSIFAQDRLALQSAARSVQSLLVQSGAATELYHHHGADLGGHRVHFGYVDGLSQPNIEGAPDSRFQDPGPPVPAGAFLLGYPSQHRDFTYPVPSPAPLGRNGSFSVFSIIRQDVKGFEAFLQEQAPRLQMSEEQLAAKMCGRWRNGIPLVLSPDTASPDPPIPADQLNNFDYVATPDGRGGDARGRRCPIGAHIRRAYPRSQRVAGDGHLHRVVRRGLPYGPLYDPAAPDDGQERGLLGQFICVSLRDQFEFLMREWINGGTFTAGLHGAKDPLVGDHSPANSRFEIPTGEGRQVISGFSQFTTVRGTAYCFLPSITALRYLANLP